MTTAALAGVVFPWTRRTVALGSTASEQGRGRSSVLDDQLGAPLEELRDVPVLALFGERGAGKSVALAQEYEALEAGQATKWWVNLGRCQTEGQARTAMTNASAPAETGEWWVFFDSVDEGLNVLPAMGSLIADWIDSLTAEQRARVRLRFNCRTGRWPEALQETLTQYWPQPLEVRHMVLAPLVTHDVAVAAGHYGLDPDDFCALLRKRGLTHLSKTPVTLLQLLEHHRAKQALPATAADAYEQACVLLCSETRRPVDIRELRAQPTGEHLLPIAARVAAAMQFGAQNVLSDVSAGSYGGEELTLAELEGGHEPGLLDGQVPCTTDELRRLTESHLFEPVGRLRWTFTHRSYQEFLAAHYLRSHEVDPRAQAGLLWVGDGAARHIYPAHREVAAWRSGSDSTLFENLLRDDPLVLLLADLPARPAEDRERVVEALFSLAQDDDTVDIDHTGLHRLDHPGLLHQLLPHIRSGVSTLVLLLALGIARRCPNPALSDALLQVAETPDLPEELRALAVQAVADVQSEEVETVDRIRRLAAHDSSPEVVAAALYRLRTGHLSLREVLDLALDPDPDYYGRASMLRSDIPARLTAEQASQALEWASDTLQQSPPRRSTILAISLISRVVTLAGTSPLPGISSPEILIAKALLALAGHQDALHSIDGQVEYKALGDALYAQHNLRRALTLHLLTRSSEGDFLRVWRAVPPGSLATYDDAYYWMEHWDELADVPLTLTRLLVSIPPPADLQRQAQVQAAASAHPSLRQLIEGWHQAHEPRHPQDTQPAPEVSRIYSEARLRQTLAAVHTASPETVRRAWGAVIDAMRCTRDGSKPPPLLTEPLLLWAHHTPSRPTSGGDLDRELKSAARHVLTTVLPLTAQLLAYGRRANPHLMPELSTFAVLETPDELPEGTPAHWAGWALALATTHAYSPSSQAVQDVFLRHCVEQAGPALTRLLGEVLHAPHVDATTTYDLADSLGVHAPPTVIDALVDWADHPDRGPELWQSITSALAFADQPRGTARLRDALDCDPSRPGTPPATLTRWLMAVQILLHSPALPHLWPLVPKRLNNARLAQACIEQLGERPIYFTQPHQLSDLDEEALAELYLCFASYTATDVLDPPLRAGWTDDDRFGELLRSIPQLIQAKSTTKAAHQLCRMASETGLWRLRLHARETAVAAARSVHVPLTAPQLRALSEQSRERRWVTDESHLLALVLESLDRFQNVLRRPNGLSVALWNRTEASPAQAEWWPCWEEDFSDIVAAFLLQDIGGARVVVNREVQLSRPGLAGGRTDIQVEVPAPSGDGHDPIRVVIECKGCWNSALSTALEQQLVDRYLHTPRTAGILLTGYFDCERWSPDRRRACPSTSHTLESVDLHQQDQARLQRARKGVPVAAFTLDCTLP
ncbi:NACHT domain-containing protein [Streptomyces sp. NPDC005004]